MTNGENVSTTRIIHKNNRIEQGCKLVVGVPIPHVDPALVSTVFGDYRVLYSIEPGSCATYVPGSCATCKPGGVLHVN